MANTSEDSLNAHNSKPTANPTYMYIYIIGLITWFIHRSTAIDVLLYFHASSITLHDLRTRTWRMYSYVGRKIIRLLLTIYQSTYSSGKFTHFSGAFFRCAVFLLHIHTFQRHLLASFKHQVGPIVLDTFFSLGFRYIP